MGIYRWSIYDIVRNRVLHQKVIARSNNAEAEANVLSCSRQILHNQSFKINMPNRPIFREMDIHPATLSVHHPLHRK